MYPPRSARTLATIFILALTVLALGLAGGVSAWRECRGSSSCYQHHGDADQYTSDADQHSGAANQHGRAYTHPNANEYAHAIRDNHQTQPFVPGY